MTAVISFAASCSIPEEKPGEKPVQKPEDSNTTGFKEEVPDTIRFTNAEFTYNGDDIGEAISDGWIIKLYTDM